MSRATSALRAALAGLASDSPRARIGIVLALVALFSGIRFINIEADTPLWIDGYYARELFVEAPAKAHEARNYALFGKWHVNAVDNYQFWRAQSPAWVYPLAFVFKTFGTGYVQLRAFATLYSALGLGVMLWLGATYLSRAALIFSGAVLAFDWVYFHYSRVGVLEPAVNSWLAVMMLALLRADMHAGWLLLACAAFTLAFFTKQAAIYGVPVLALGMLWSLTRPVREPRDRVWRRVVVAGAVLLFALCALYMSSGPYKRAIAHNVQHVLAGDTGSRAWFRLRTLWVRLTDTEKLRHFQSSVPLTGPLALATAVFWTAVSVHRRRFDLFQFVAAAWFVCSMLAMVVLSQSELRFWALPVLPAALLAAAGLDAAYHALAKHPATKQFAWAVFAVAFASMLSLDSRGLQRALFHPAYTIRDGARALREHIGEREAVIVGLASPPLVLGTPYKNYYVRDNFNSKRKALQRLGITHILLNEGPDISRDIFQREFPGLLRRLRADLVIPVRNLKLKLYPVGDKLVNFRPPWGALRQPRKLSARSEP